MTTGIIHGDPGSYKTATLVNDYLVPAVKAGRLVVTNIRGVKSVDDIAEIYGFDLPDEAEIIIVPFDSKGFERMAKFFHWAPAGALILMDEGQRIYPTRLRSFSHCDLIDSEDEIRPRTVEDSFDSHRHMNWDIYISTPNISKVHKEIRAVAEFGYRHKNLASVFSFLAGRYKRVTHNAENAGNAVGHTISSTMRKIDTRCFDVYQSTATGKTKDTSSSLKFFRQPKILLLLGVIIYSAINLGNTFLFGGGLPRMFGGSSQPAAGSSSVAPSGVLPQANNGVRSSVDDQRLSNTHDLRVSPLRAASIYFVGSISDEDLFQVEYEDGTFITLTSTDLEAIGYTVEYRSNAFVKLRFYESETIAYQIPSEQFSGFSDPAVIGDPTQNITASF